MSMVNKIGLEEVEVEEEVEIEAEEEVEVGEIKTFLDFLSSRVFFFSKARIHFSTAIASFIFFANVGLAALSTKMDMFEGKAEIYHSLQILH